MQVIYFKGTDTPEVCYVRERLDVLQNLVGGMIETVVISGGLYVVCNEEGRIVNLPVNWLYKDGVVRMPIYGDFFVCGRDSDGELQSIPDEKIDEVSVLFHRFHRSTSITHLSLS